jgi:hypothetical protein
MHELTHTLLRGVIASGKLARDRLESGARWDAYLAAADTQDELSGLHAEACHAWAGLHKQVA